MPSLSYLRPSSRAPAVSTSSDLTPQPSSDGVPPAPTPATSQRPSSAPPPPPAEGKVAHRPCLVCKQRRVRCGRHLPACSRCEERGDDCSYPAKPTYFAAPTSSSRELEPKNGEEKAKEPSENEQEQKATPGELSHLPLGDAPVIASLPRPPDHPDGQKDEEAPSRSLPSPASPIPPFVPPAPLSNLVLPTLPRPGPTQKQKMARQAREASTGAMLFGAAAELEKIGGALKPRTGLASLYIDLSECDASYVSSISPPLLSPLSVTLPVNPNDALNPSTTLTANQAHVALTAYFRTIEPEHPLYTSSSSRLGFQEQCLGMWQPSSSSTSTTPQEQTRSKGWWAMYLATVSLGLMAAMDEELKSVGLSDEEGEKQQLARGLAEEAARSLGDEGFATKPTLEGLRAALLLLAFDLGGLSSMPDIPSALSALPIVVGAAYELGLNREPGSEMSVEGKEERRGLWCGVFELEAAWSPLLNRRLILVHPSSFSTRPLLLSSPTLTYPLVSSALHSALLFTNKLSNLLNSPYTLIPLDLVPLIDQYEHIPRQGEGGDILAELVRQAAGLRLRAVRDECGDRPTEAEEKTWGELAYDLVCTPTAHILQIERFPQLLATATLFHSLVLIALRLALCISPSPSLLGAFPALLHSVKTTNWPMHLHQTVRRGIIILEHLLPVVGPPFSAA